MPPTPTDTPTHTPEPWAEWEPGCIRPDYGGRLGTILAKCDQPANAARIVACVNACAGMADPGAEIKALRTALRNLADRVDNMERPDGSSPPTWEAHAALGDFTPTPED